MPNIDSGHYFLTVLVPLLLSGEVGADGSIATPANRLREVLAMMPTTGMGDEATLYGQTRGDRGISPFSRNRLNHFVRFVVIEDVNYNGRMNGDGIMEALGRVDPAAPQAMDHLARPYLLFAAEFDPNPDGAPEPDVYLHKLWATMEPELKAIFRHCYGFVEVKSAGDFARYIKRCQIETTMPFGDYWQAAPALKGLPMLPVAAMALAAGAAAGWGVAILAAALGGWRWPLAILVGLLVAAGAVLVSAKRHAARPFPTAPDSDLETILKSLYLQRAFVDFAIEHQGATPAALHHAFREFLITHRPGEPEPTQPPAVVGA
jgi:hypothetical protein